MQGLYFKEGRMPLVEEGGNKGRKGGGGGKGRSGGFSCQKRRAGGGGAGLAERIWRRGRDFKLWLCEG